MRSSAHVYPPPSERIKAMLEGSLSSPSIDLVSISVHTIRSRCQLAQSQQVRSAHCKQRARRVRPSALLSDPLSTQHREPSPPPHRTCATTCHQQTIDITRLRIATLVLSRITPMSAPQPSLDRSI